MKKIRMSFAGGILALSMLLSGCSSASPAAIVTGTTPEPKKLAIDFEKAAKEVTVTDTAVTFVDAAGQTVTLKKNPQRVVGLYNSYIGLWAQAGGRLVGRIDSDSELPEEIVKDSGIAKVGTLTKESIEAVTALNPDLVIMREGKQGAYSDSFKTNKIPYIAMEYDSFSDYLKWLKVFTALTGKEDLYETTGTALLNEIDGIIKNVPVQNNPKVLLMFGTSSSVKAYLSTTAVGEMLKQLKAVNIADPWQSSGGDATSVTLNTEYLMTEDPEYILVQCMSSEKEVKAYIDKTYGGQQWWKDLRAVKNGKVIYLDRSLFHYKPNSKYAVAYRNLASILYPGAFPSDAK